MFQLHTKDHIHFYSMWAHTEDPPQYGGGSGATVNPTL